MGLLSRIDTIPDDDLKRYTFIISLLIKEYTDAEIIKICLEQFEVSEQKVNEDVLFVKQNFKYSA